MDFNQEKKTTPERVVLGVVLHHADAILDGNTGRDHFFDQESGLSGYRLVPLPYRSHLAFSPEQIGNFFG
jgi:hypothetical protein